MDRKLNLSGFGCLGYTLLGVVLTVFMMLVFNGLFGYLLISVSDEEVGVKTVAGNVVDVLGPGVYSDPFLLWGDITTYDARATNFCASDLEVITRDKQRIGVKVCADVIRPKETSVGLEEFQALWRSYKKFYTDDATLFGSPIDAENNYEGGKMPDFTKQAMKVCVGDQTFDDNIIGTARDALRSCIDGELSELASSLGLEVTNVVVPNVILSQEAQAALDAITASRLETEKAAQDKLRADAQALAEQARQEGEIRVEQSRIQEQTKQQITLAKLEQEKILAQKAVIEANKANELAQVEAQNRIILAEKANELLAAEQQVAINEAKVKAAELEAEAALAQEARLSQLMADHPEYARYLTVEAAGKAIQDGDKIISGSIDPVVILGGAPNINVPAPATNP